MKWNRRTDWDKRPVEEPVLDPLYTGFVPSPGMDLNVVHNRLVEAINGLEARVRKLEEKQD